MAPERREASKMLISLTIWIFEALAAAAVSAVVASAALFVGLALWLHAPRHQTTAGDLQPLFAVDDYDKQG
jgi:hypothetical protein